MDSAIKLMGCQRLKLYCGDAPSRQLHSFQTGTRNGSQAVLMKPIVAGLTQRDLIDLSVYVASLEP